VINKTTATMDSQTSADDNGINEFINNFDRCSCSILSHITLGVSSGCCAKDIVDKLMAKLEEKDKQLEENKKAIEVGGYFRIFSC
jgi:hypothetical protein